MIGQRRTSQPGRHGQFTDRHAFLAGLHQQAKQIQAVLLGECVEAGEGIFLFHISRIIEIFKRVKPCCFGHALMCSLDC